MELPQLGGRGGGWVAGQFLLLGITAVVALLGYRAAPPPAASQLLGGALALLGAAVAVWAAASLGKALVPWPRPVGEEVVSRGPYGWVRHPIYTGGLLVCVGASAATTFWALAPTALLAVWWALKCRVEERLLRSRFASYDDYCSRVRWRMLPAVY